VTAEDTVLVGALIHLGRHPIPIVITAGVLGDGIATLSGLAP
jgi:hypothetical protein